jgi:hypothetical protein
MTQIVSMSSGAIDPIAESKRVFFRPTTTTDVLRVGDLVCYNSDLVSDHKERTVDPTHLGLTIDTYAEGEQEFTGRLFIVEKPKTANLDAFAGVVKCLGPKAGADGDMIEIWIPNGAVLPVMCDQDCINNRTIVGVRDGAYEGSYPGRPIGIAKETYARSAADGLVWVKVDPNMFLWQHNSTDYDGLIIDAECGASFTLNHIRLETAHTAGTAVAQSTRLVLNGAGTGYAGQFEVDIAAAITTTFRVLDLVLWLTADAAWQATYADGSAVVRICIGSNAAHPDLAGLGLSGISFQNYLNETSGAPEFLYPFWFHSGAGSKWDGLLYCDSSDLGITAATGDTAHDGSDFCIPVMIDGDVYYLIAQDSTG